MINLISRLINITRLTLIQCIYTAVCFYYTIIWSPWNPWALARLNLAWTKYTKTPMYEERKKIDFLGFDRSKYGNYAELAYVEYNEALFFTKCFNRKDKLKIIFLPFSCGDKYRMPFWQVRNWILGIEND